MKYSVFFEFEFEFEINCVWKDFSVFESCSELSAVCVNNLFNDFLDKTIMSFLLFLSISLLFGL